MANKHPKLTADEIIERIDALIRPTGMRCLCGFGQSCEHCSSYSQYNQLRDKLRHLAAEAIGKPIQSPTPADYRRSITISRREIASQ